MTTYLLTECVSAGSILQANAHAYQAQEILALKKKNS